MLMNNLKTLPKRLSTFQGVLMSSSSALNDDLNRDLIGESIEAIKLMRTALIEIKDEISDNNKIDASLIEGIINETFRALEENF